MNAYFADAARLPASDPVPAASSTHVRTLCALAEPVASCHYLQIKSNLYLQIMSFPSRHSPYTLVVSIIDAPVRIFCSTLIMLLALTLCTVADTSGLLDSLPWGQCTYVRVRACACVCVRVRVHAARVRLLVHTGAPKFAHLCSRQAWFKRRTLCRPTCLLHTVCGESAA